MTKWRSKNAIERAELMLVAINLHGYYTAFETLCERVARQLDENVPTGPTWHAELLAQMQVEVPGLRPRVVDHAATEELHELHKFRHFFRNAYVLDFDPALVAAHAERVLRIHPLLRSGIAGLQLHVDGLQKALVLKPPG